jgi:hypothetical protein
MSFSELCNDFECNSSPQVRNTARQLAKDILEIKEGARSTGVFAKDVQYKVRGACLRQDFNLRRKLIEYGSVGLLVKVDTSHRAYVQIHVSEKYTSKRGQSGRFVKKPK